MGLTQLFGEPQKTAHISKQLEEKGTGLQAHCWQLGSSKTHDEGYAKTSGRTIYDIPGQFGGEGTSSNHPGSVVFMACKRKRDSSFICYGVISHLTNVTMGRSNSFKSSSRAVMNSLSKSASSSSCKEEGKHHFPKKSGEI